MTIEGLRGTAIAGTRTIESATIGVHEQPLPTLTVEAATPSRRDRLASRDDLGR
jgi:hypothetical protein